MGDRRGLCDWNGGWICRLGSILSVVPLRISVSSPNVLVCDKVVYHVIDVEVKLGEPHMFFLVVSNVATI